jgi:hypothetical protein
MQHISALNLSSFWWKFLHRNLERYVWNNALDVRNCLRSFRFARIHIFSIFWVWISGSRLITGTLLELRLNILKNNLRRPFENCEFTPLLYRITQFRSGLILRYLTLSYFYHSRVWKFLMWIWLYLINYLNNEYIRNIN